MYLSLKLQSNCSSNVSKIGVMSLTTSADFISGLEKFVKNIVTEHLLSL